MCGVVEVYFSAPLQPKKTLFGQNVRYSDEILLFEYFGHKPYRDINKYIQTVSITENFYLEYSRQPPLI